MTAQTQTPSLMTASLTSVVLMTVIVPIEVSDAVINLEV